MASRLRFGIGLLSGLTITCAANGAALSAKADAARLSGTWLVAPGEILSRICHNFAPQQPILARKCVRDFAAENPRHLRPDAPDKLAVGVLLLVPASLRLMPTGVAAPTATDAKIIAAIAPATGDSDTGLSGGVRANPVTKPDIPPRIATSAPATVPAPAAAQPVYRDKLMANVEPEQDEKAGGSSATDLSRGQRFVSVELLAESKDESARGRGHEQAINAQYRQETENWGEWAFDIAARQLVTAPGDPVVGRGNTPRATLLHSLFPITERWVANSALGVIRNPINPLVTNSYRISLPTPLYVGVASTIGDGQREIRFATGQIGTLTGLAASAFERTNGSFASIGGNLRIADRWSVGGQAISVRDVTSVVEHTSLAGVLRYQLPQRAGGASLHALTDGRGRAGIWSDADVTLDGVRHQFGLFRLDPSLLWADSQIANDQQGLYWRANLAGLRQFWSGGISYDDTNIQRDPTRGGQESVSGFVGTTLRLDRRLSVGGNISIQSTRPRDANTQARRTFSGSLFANLSHWLGVSRIDAARYLLRPEASTQDSVDTLSISHDWPALGEFSINTALTGSRENSAGMVTRRESANLGVRSPSGGDLTWDLAVAIARVTGPRGTEKNINASVGGYWRISNDLSASAQFIWSTIDAAAPLPGVVVNPFRREKRLALSIRYEQASGMAFGTAGSLQERRFGTGRITGIVFFDENGDGVRQANERGAGNLTVFLDGRIPVTTDSNGRYVFSSVATGLRTLFISADILPLPWTLESENGFRVTVPLRGEAVFDIPLVRLNR